MKFIFVMMNEIKLKDGDLDNQVAVLEYYYLDVVILFLKTFV